MVVDESFFFKIIWGKSLLNEKPGGFEHSKSPWIRVLVQIPKFCLKYKIKKINNLPTNIP